MSGGRPNKAPVSGQHQQAKSVSPPLVVQQPQSTDRQQAHACPETHQTKYDCNTVSAIANVRQADAAEWFNHAAVVEIGVGLITAGVAYFAAKFARDAVNAARENLAHDKAHAKEQLRPWVCFNGVETRYFVNGAIINGQHVPRMLAAIINLINTGQTPALNCRPIIRHQLTPFQQNEAPTFPPHAEEFVDAGAAGPGRPISTATRTLGPPDCDTIMNGAGALWLYARVEYEGPDHKGDPYVTEITVRTGIESISPTGGEPTFRVRIAGPQNTMT